MKELQNTSNQIADSTHKISFNFYKSCDQKIEELKSSFERSIQSFGYNLTHCHRDIKEAKEDISYMKNKIEILEKSPKVQTIETHPTNYYQLFYKLLDILLTLATIILLAFTNMIASIKFIFLLYPRTIVILLFIYFILFYIVDYDKLDFYFDRFLLHESTGRLGDQAIYLNSNHFKSNSSYFIRVLNSIYGLIFQIKSNSNTQATSGTGSSTS